MNLLRHGNIDLPVYPFVDVSLDKIGMNHAAVSSENDFLRLAATAGFGETLAQRLEMADRHFEILGDLCGIQIVGHSWGLCELPTDREVKPDFHDDALPSGYLLVAKVTTIVPINYYEPLTDEQYEKYTSGRLLYEGGLKTPEDEPRLIDIGLRQVMIGRQKSRPEDDIQLWYVDIEPRFRRNIPVFANACHALDNAK